MEKVALPRFKPVELFFASTTSIGVSTAVTIAPPSASCQPAGRTPIGSIPPLAAILNVALGSFSYPMGAFVSSMVYTLPAIRSPVVTTEAPSPSGAIVISVAPPAKTPFILNSEPRRGLPFWSRLYTMMLVGSSLAVRTLALPSEERSQPSGSALPAQVATPSSEMTISISLASGSENPSGALVSATT